MFLQLDLAALVSRLAFDLLQTIRKHPRLDRNGLLARPQRHFHIWLQLVRLPCHMGREVNVALRSQLVPRLLTAAGGSAKFRDCRPAAHSCASNIRSASQPESCVIASPRHFTIVESLLPRASISLQRPVPVVRRHKALHMLQRIRKRHVLNAAIFQPNILRHLGRDAGPSLSIQQRNRKSIAPLACSDAHELLSFRRQAPQQLLVKRNVGAGNFNEPTGVLGPG